MMGWFDVPPRRRLLLCLSGWRMRQRYGDKTIGLLLAYWSDLARRFVPASPLQYRQVRNELAIEKIVRQRSIDGRSQFQRSRHRSPSTTLNVPR